MKPIFSIPVVRYAAPFLGFLFLGLLQKEGNPQSVFWLYALKIFASGFLLLYCFRGHWKEIQGRMDIKAIALGILVFGIWVVPEMLRPHSSEIEFNPNVFSSPLMRWTAIFSRAFGAVLIVPLIEEIFFRSFLMRYFIQKDFLSVPLGAYRLVSFFGTAALFALMHPSGQWSVAALAGILYGGYLVRTKNLAGCILAHGTTNLCLVIFVLATQQWRLW